MKYGGSLVGKSCKFVPDLALMSFILFFGTYSMTVSLKKFKFSRYFPTKVRDGSKIAKVKLTSPACSVENIQSREKLNVARNYIAIKKVSVRISQSCFWSLFSSQCIIPWPNPAQNSSACCALQIRLPETCLCFTYYLSHTPKTSRMLNNSRQFISTTECTE